MCVWGGHVGEYMATLHYLLNFSEKSKTILKKIKPTNKKYKTENKEPCMKTYDGESLTSASPQYLRMWLYLEIGPLER